MSTTVNLQSILDANKLTGTNFIDRLSNLRIVLKSEKIAYVLDAPLPVSPYVGDQIAYQKHIDDSIIAACVMLASMSPGLQKQHEAMTTYDIAAHLKELFHEQARSERFEVSKMLFRSKMQEGTSPIQYALKMHRYIVRLKMHRTCFHVVFNIKGLESLSLPTCFPVVFNINGLGPVFSTIHGDGLLPRI